MDKKKLFAIVLFFLMGFFMFTNANPSDGTKKIKEEQIDDTSSTKEELINEICFQSAYNINKDYILKSISDTKNILINNFYDEQKKKEKSNYSKDYRTYREID